MHSAAGSHVRATARFPAHNPSCHCNTPPAQAPATSTDRRVYGDWIRLRLRRVPCPDPSRCCSRAAALAGFFEAVEIFAAP